MTPITISPYERQHRETVLNLIFYSEHSHSHLDWYRVGHWLDTDEGVCQLAWQGDDLLGVIGISENIEQTAWLRLLALSNRVPDDEILPPLWASLEGYLREQGEIEALFVLSLQGWLIPYLRDVMHFSFMEEVITLQRDRQTLPPAPQNRAYEIRDAFLADLPEILYVDQHSFIPPWQLSYHDLYQAQRHAANFTVAVREHQIIGYQLSTRYHESGHLARLAVHHDYQGQGIGRGLVYAMLESMFRGRVKIVTVNTQASNKVSQHLYESLQFKRNGFDLPIWRYDLNR